MATLNDLRASLTADQRRVLNAIWHYQREKKLNMPKITLLKELNTDETTLQATLEGLSGNIIYSSSNSEVLRSYGLRELGYLLADKGEELEDLLARYLGNVRTQLDANPDLDIDQQAAMRDGFSPEESSFLREMIYKTSFHGHERPRGLPPYIDEWYSLSSLSDLRSYIQEKAMKDYDPDTPIGGSILVSGHNNYISPSSVLHSDDVPDSGQVVPHSVVSGTRDYIEKIVYQINGAYENSWFDCCAVMIRRLIETLIIEAFESHEIADKIKNSTGDFVFLRDLINLTLAEATWNLGRTSRVALPKLNDIGNLSAHSRRFIAQRQDIDRVLDDLRVITQEFVYLARLM